MTYSVGVPIIINATYRVELSNKAAKTICAEFLDPDESWESQAVDTLETALEFDFEGFLSDRFSKLLPAKLGTHISGVKVTLKLDGDEASVELESLEVEE